MLLGAGSFAAISQSGGLNVAVNALPSQPISMSDELPVIGMYIAGATISADISLCNQLSGAWAWFLQIIVQPLLMLCRNIDSFNTCGDMAKAMVELGMGLDL